MAICSDCLGKKSFAAVLLQSLLSTPTVTTGSLQGIAPHMDSDGLRHHIVPGKSFSSAERACAT